MPAGMVCGIAALAAVLPLIAQDARPSVGRTWPLMSGDLPRTKAVQIRSLSFRLRVRRELIGNARMKDRFRRGMVVVGTYSGPLFVEVRDPALRHSREITRVCSRRVTHRPNWPGMIMPCPSAAYGPRCGAGGGQLYRSTSGQVLVSAEASLAGLPAGRVRVVIRSLGFKTVRRAVIVSEGTESAFEARLESDESIEPHSGRLSLKITGPAQRVLPNAEVVLKDAAGTITKARTNGLGTEDFPAFPAGNCHLEIDDPGFKPWRTPCFVDDAGVERLNVNLERSNPGI